MNYITEYYEKIKSGEFNAPKYVHKQYEKIISIIDDEDPLYYYDPLAAEKPIDFAEKFCRQSKGAWVGKPIELLLWQKAALSSIYGILERATDYRKFKQVFILCGKGNGKTTMIAPICLYETGRRGQGVYCAANSLPQAKLLWTEAWNMLEQSHQLKSILKKKQYDIVNLRPNGFSTFTPLANMPNLLDGKTPNTVVLDEIHELQQSLYDILQNGQNKISANTLLFMLTTKGYIRQQLFDAEYENSRDILDGKIQNERKFSLLYELDDPKDWQNEKNWQQANPSLGTTITIENLRDAVADGLAKPSGLNSIKTKHFNIGGVSENGCFEYDDVKNDRTFDIEKFRKYDAIGGFDLSLTNDLTAFCTLFWDDVNHEFCVDIKCWVSEDFYKKNVNDPRMGDTWRVWVEKGYIAIAGKNSIDYTAIVKYACGLVDKLGIRYRWIYYDNYSARYLINEFVKEGFGEDVCLVRCKQGGQTLSVPFQKLSAELKDKNINYNNNPVFLWALTNVGTREDANKNILPEKAGITNARKIDPFAVTLNAFVGVVEHYEEFVA